MERFPACAGKKHWSIPRSWSPWVGSSLMTSAPRSARRRDEYGPAKYAPRSRIFTPSSSGWSARPPGPPGPPGPVGPGSPARPSAPTVVEGLAFPTGSGVLPRRRGGGERNRAERRKLGGRRHLLHEAEDGIVDLDDHLVVARLWLVEHLAGE